MSIDKALIGDLMRSGLSYPQIADHFGVSRQSIHQVAVSCFPELAREYAERRAQAVTARRMDRKYRRFLHYELPNLVKEWLFTAGYARCMICKEWKCLDLFPPSVTPYRISPCGPCNAARLKEYRVRVPVEARKPGGWRTLTDAEREERVKQSKTGRWGG